jgi:hypothetical protein
MFGMRIGAVCEVVTHGYTLLRLELDVLFAAAVAAAAAVRGQITGWNSSTGAMDFQFTAVDILLLGKQVSGSASATWWAVARLNHLVANHSMSVMGSATS